MSARTAPNAARKRQIKASLIRRDGMACFYCRTPFATVAEATVDHLVPQAFVPGWRLANLVLACPACNAAKADMLPQELLRPSGYGPGLVPLAGTAHPYPFRGAPYQGAHRGAFPSAHLASASAHFALAGAA